MILPIAAGIASTAESVVAPLAGKAAEAGLGMLNGALNPDSNDKKGGAGLPFQLPLPSLATSFKF
jgi:hypothetical protein